MSAPDDENVDLSATEVQSVQLIQTYTFYKLLWTYDELACMCATLWK